MLRRPQTVGWSGDRPNCTKTGPNAKIATPATRPWARTKNEEMGAAMTSKIPLSMAVCDYDRCRAVLNGTVPVDGCEILPTPVEPEEAFHRAFKYAEFDVSELSLSSFTMLTSRGESPYVGIPVYVSRLFRHSGIYIRTDRGIDDASKLQGLTIGLPE